MPITEVRIRPISNQGKVRALASITFAGVFAVHGLRVIAGKSGLFVAMPQLHEPATPGFSAPPLSMGQPAAVVGYLADLTLTS